MAIGFLFDYACGCDVFVSYDTILGKDIFIQVLRQSGTRRWHGPCDSRRCCSGKVSASAVFPCGGSKPFEVSFRCPTKAPRSLPRAGLGSGRAGTRRALRPHHASGTSRASAPFPEIRSIRSLRRFGQALARCLSRQAVRPAAHPAPWPAAAPESLRGRRLFRPGGRLAPWTRKWRLSTLRPAPPLLRIHPLAPGSFSLWRFAPPVGAGNKEGTKWNRGRGAPGIGPLARATARPGGRGVHQAAAAHLRGGIDGLRQSKVERFGRSETVKRCGLVISHACRLILTLVDI